MFDLVIFVSSDSASRRAVDPLAWIATLSDHDGEDLSDAERIDQISDLERLKAAAAAAQARITEAFDRSQRKATPTLNATAEVSRSIAAPGRTRSTRVSRRVVSSISALRPAWSATCHRPTMR